MRLRGGGPSEEEKDECRGSEKSSAQENSVWAAEVLWNT